MPYSLSVYRSPEDRKGVFFVQIAPVADFQRYWVEPAQRFNLPMIAGLENTQVEISGADLLSFRIELVFLWEHLAQTTPRDEMASVQISVNYPEVRVPLVVTLIQGIANVISAIDLAHAIEGRIEIGP